MHSLHMLPDGVFAVRDDRESKILFRDRGLKLVLGFMLRHTGIDESALARALMEMEDGGHNMAEFGMNGTFMGCRTVDHSLA